MSIRECVCARAQRTASISGQQSPESKHKSSQQHNFQVQPGSRMCDGARADVVVSSSSR